jgi:hypothetical protein
LFNTTSYLLDALVFPAFDDDLLCLGVAAIQNTS